MTPTGDVWYDTNLQSKVAGQHKTFQEENRDDIQTRYVYENVKTHEGNIKAQETPRGEMLLVTKTSKEDKNRGTQMERLRQLKENMEHDSLLKKASTSRLLTGKAARLSGDNAVEIKLLKE